jgi:hypothetical protein
MKTKGSLRLKNIDWTQKLSKEEMKAINRVLSILKQHPSVYPKLERASQEIFNELDDTKDPYTIFYNLKDKVEVISDGQVVHGNSYGGGDSFVTPVTVSNYNFIVTKHFDKDKLVNMTVIVKTYPMRIYLLTKLNTPANIN